MALANFINICSILGGPFSGAQGLGVLGSSCELVFANMSEFWILTLTFEHTAAMSKWR